MSWIGIATGGVTAHHLIGEMFKLKSGTDIVHIPYRGSAPALTDLIGGSAPSIVEKLNRQVVEIVNSPEARARMLDLGAEPVGNSSVEMAAQINKELETFGALTKQLQLMVD